MSSQRLAQTVQKDAVQKDAVSAPSLLFAVADINVDLDLTFVAQLMLFAAFVMVMKPLLFDPLLRVFRAREQATEGAREEGRGADERAASLLARYEGELEGVRRAASTERDRLRAETSRLEAKILDEGRAEAQRILDQGKARIQADVAALRAELAASRPKLAAEIASKILGREVSS